MSYTQADLDKLRSVMASGVLEVRFEDGRSKKFQSLSEMLALSRVMESQISVAAQRASGFSRRKFATFSKGT